MSTVTDTSTDTRNDRLIIQLPLHCVLSLGETPMLPARRARPKPCLGSWPFLSNSSPLATLRHPMSRVRRGLAGCHFRDLRSSPESDSRARDCCSLCPGCIGAGSGTEGRSLGWAYGRLLEECVRVASDA